MVRKAEEPNDIGREEGGGGEREREREREAGGKWTRKVHVLVQVCTVEIDIKSTQ